MKSKVYLETSFISYLAAKISRDILIAANQQVSQDWWHNRRDRFELYISALVEREVSIGDSEAVIKRKQALDQYLRQNRSKKIGLFE